MYYTTRSNSTHVYIRHRNLAIVLGIILCIIILSGILNFDELISSTNHLNPLEWNNANQANYASIQVNDGSLGNCEAYKNLLAVLAPALLRIKASPFKIENNKYKVWIGKFFVMKNIPRVETSLN